MESNTVNLKDLGGLIFTLFLIPLILVISGWDLGWWQGWFYSVLIIVASIVPRILAEKRHPRIANRTRENGQSTECEVVG